MDILGIAHGIWPYIGLAIVALLVLNVLAQSLPLVRSLMRVGLWCVILAIAIGLFQQRSLFAPYLDRFTRSSDSEVADDQPVSGEQRQISVARESHWAHARINGVPRRILIDSGVTIAALPTNTSDAA